MYTHHGISIIFRNSHKHRKPNFLPVSYLVNSMHSGPCTPMLLISSVLRNEHSLEEPFPNSASNKVDCPLLFAKDSTTSLKKSCFPKLRFSNICPEKERDTQQIMDTVNKTCVAPSMLLFCWDDKAIKNSGRPSTEQFIKTFS